MPLDNDVSSAKKFQLYDKETSYEETKNFIENYRQNIFKKNSRYTHILKYVDSGERILDYGCGWGSFTHAIADKGIEIVGIDQDYRSLEIANEFNSADNIKYSNKKITDFPVESFDSIVSTQVLEHVHNPGMYLMQCNNALKSRGSLIISVPNVINLNFLKAQLSKKLSTAFKINSEAILRDYSKTHDHIQAWDPITFIRLNASLGFKYLEHKFMEGAVLPWGRPGQSRWPWKKYWHTNNKRLSQLSYTMLFKFEKEKYVEIDCND